MLPSASAVAAPRRATSISSGSGGSVSVVQPAMHKAPRSALSGGPVDNRISKQIRAAWAAAPAAAAAVPSAGVGAEESKQQLPRGHSALSHLNSPPSSPPLMPIGVQRADSVERPSSRPSSAGLARSGNASAMLNPHLAAQLALPPHLAHLHYAHHTFPIYMLQIAVKLFRAKCKDLNVQPSRDKERRFVWLVCRQSMGGGASSAAAASEENSPTAEGSADANGNGGNLLSFRVPDAALGPHALRELCAFLANDRRFGHLQLSGNVLGDEGAARLSDLLRSNSSLTSLDVRATGLGQQAFGGLLDAITEHPALTSLDCSSIKSEGRMFLGAKGCKSLAALLRKNTVLRRLHLANAGFVAEGVPLVFRGLAANTGLTSLNLGQNDLGPRGISRLSDALHHLPGLEELLLPENAMTTSGAVLLAEGLRRLENLKRLDLRRNGIALRGFTVLSDAVGDMISLEELLLDGNALTSTETAGAGGSRSAGGGGGGTTSGGAAGAAGGGNSGSAMLSAVSGLHNGDYRASDLIESVLKRLHLVDKRVSPRFLLNTALRTLSLNATSLSDRVLEDIARVLASHKALQNLHINNNQLTDVGGSALAELVRLSPSLRSLSAADNSVGDEGGAAIAAALATPTSPICFLSLRVNNVGKATATAALVALARKKTLHVDLSGGQVPWILYSKVAELSNKNRRNFEASLSGRYQEEWEQLLQRHEFRLQVEEQCVESVSQVSALQDSLHQLEESQGRFIDQETEQTKALQAELDARTHELHEMHAAERAVEASLASHLKELEGKVQSLRKGIELERRFIVSAEKLIPATIEERANVDAEIEAGCVDLRRDFRLYLTDRNAELEGLALLKNDLDRFVRELEAKVKPAGGRGSPNKRGGAGGGARSRSNSRPGSGRKARSPSPPKGKLTRPPSASGSASASAANTRPNSARKTAVAASGPVLATPTPGARPRSSVAAAPKVAGKTPAPSSAKKKSAAGGSSKKKVSAKASKAADAPVVVIDAMSPRATPAAAVDIAAVDAPLSPVPDASGSALVALAQSNAAAPS